MSSTYPIETGTSNKAIRKEVIDSMVKQIAARSYKFKQACAVVPTSSWKSTFFREDLSISDGPSGNKFQGIPRGANFPHSETNWQEKSVRIVKFGTEMNIPWEDIIAGELNVLARNLIRRTEEVTKAVDDYIWDQLTSGFGNSSLEICSFATTHPWNEASGAVVDDFMHAKQVINETGNYDTAGLICFVSPRDERSIKKYLADKGSQWEPIATDIARNGQIGRVAGVTLVTSTSVSASYALVVKPKTCATLKQLVPIQSTQIDDPFKSLKIRVVEECALELTDPKAVCLIMGTQNANA